MKDQMQIPKTLSLSHLRTNLKKIQIDSFKNYEQQRENRILFEKMKNIHKFNFNSNFILA